MRREVLLLVLLAACNSKLCARKSDCAPPATCTGAGACEVTTDAAVVETPATPDAAVADAYDASLDAPTDGEP